MTIKNVICMHEEDVGILWKHFDARSGETEVRRNRRLVVSYICTVGNYDYAFYWYFYQDGTIEHEIKATGIMQTQAVRPGESPQYGTLVAPQLGAMYHQHFFNYRLDMMVDGLQNSVEEVNMEPLPMGPENPYGNAMKRTVKVFTRESEARSDMNVARARFWRIVNPSMKNGLGQPTAYRLLPGWGGTTGGNSSLLVHPDSWLARRAAFATHHVWVTKFDPHERYSAGNYPNQQPPDKEGILKWQADDAPLENEDIVVWYTVGETHVPRPEDWPLTNVERIGFTLKPDGFFDRNPALDVPPPLPHCSAHHGDQSVQSREEEA
jgi:primary-amine oxidase